MAKSIYPIIPAPGNDMPSIQASLGAMRQTLNMMILNAQHPNPNFAPSSAAQVFVTYDQLHSLGVVNKSPSTGNVTIGSGVQGPPGLTGPAGPVGPAGSPGATGPAGPGSTPSSTLPLMDGVAAIGVGTTYARADHVHPQDTSVPVFATLPA